MDQPINRQSEEKFSAACLEARIVSQNWLACHGIHIVVIG